MSCETERRTGSEKNSSLIVTNMQRQIVDVSKDRAEKQIGCHNDGSGGGHNDN